MSVLAILVRMEQVAETKSIDIPAHVYQGTSQQIAKQVISVERVSIIVISFAYNNL